MGFGKDHKGAMVRQSIQSALATLASDTGLNIGTDPPLTADFRMLKWEGEAIIEGLTAGEATGLSLYLADGELSLGEIEACLENDGPNGPNEQGESAIAERFVKLVATVVGGKADTKVRFVGPDGGPVFSVKPRWTFAHTTSWTWLVYNHSGQLTTGATLKLMGTAFGVWIR